MEYEETVYDAMTVDERLAMARQSYDAIRMSLEKLGEHLGRLEFIAKEANHLCRGLPDGPDMRRDTADVCFTLMELTNSHGRAWESLCVAMEWVGVGGGRSE